MSNEAAMMVMSTREKAAPEMTPEQKSSVEARQPTGMGQTMSSPILQTRRLPALSHATSVVQGPPSSSESMPLPGGHPAMPPGSRKDEAAGRSNILPTMSKAPRKRKRGQSLQPIPESQQIFKGKSFCQCCGRSPIPFHIDDHRLPPKRQHRPRTCITNSQSPRVGGIVDSRLEGWYHACRSRQWSLL